MINTTGDLRVIKTKEAIQEAFFDLIEEKDFGEITIKEITTKAKVNRGTFYAHYEDKFDLLNTYKKDFMIEIAAFFKQNQDTLGDETMGYQSIPEPCPPFIVGIIEFLEQNKRFLKVALALSAEDNLSFMIEVKDLIQKHLFAENSAIIKSDDLLVPDSYFTTYVVSAFIGVVSQWLFQEGEESSLEIAQIISILNLKGPYYAVKPGLR